MQLTDQFGQQAESLMQEGPGAPLLSADLVQAVQQAIATYKQALAACSPSFKLLQNDMP